MTEWTRHNICNELIELNGDIAYSESYLVAYHRVKHDGREFDFLLGARYLDRFERAGELAYRPAHGDPRLAAIRRGAGSSRRTHPGWLF